MSFMRWGGGFMWPESITVNGAITSNAGAITATAGDVNCVNVVATGSAAAVNAANGTELWRTDGTAAGTTLVTDISTGAANRAYEKKTGERKFMVGVDLHAVMLANQQGGTIRGVAIPVRVGRRITVVRTQVWGDGDRLLAEVTTTHVPFD